MKKIFFYLNAKGKEKAKPKNRSVTFYLSQEDRDLLKEVARRQKVSMADLVRKLVRDGANLPKNKKLFDF
ncbi:hypothetical protein AB834_00055 [PVC group bacterium (ex Bugula neritina AB1)]|nr:hypothetical protein AB834_00055 [PVC group bacterium (ex Bugula neritina AB1)]